MLSAGDEFDGVLVWVDPISKCGETRATLNEMLRRVSSHGVPVSAHPDLIDRIGTKEVLHATKHLSWGCSDTQLYPSMATLRQRLFGSVVTGPRILKLLRGSAGDGVWKVSLDASNLLIPGGGKGRILLQSAGDDAVSELGSTSELFDRLETLSSSSASTSVTGGGGTAAADTVVVAFVDQPFQPRVSEGMLRVYLIREQPVALLHQLPRPGGLNVSRSGLCVTDGLPAGERLYTAGHTLFDELAGLLTREWLPALRATLGLRPEQRLPVIWDADFLMRSTAASPPRPQLDSESNFVLCEINCSCVFPGALLPQIAAEVKRSLEDGQFGCEIAK